MKTTTVTYQGGPSAHPHPAEAEPRVLPDKLRALWGMTAAERIAAMWNGELTLRQLCHWSSRRPDEVPLLAGEFAWIVIRKPDWAEASERVREAA